MHENNIALSLFFFFVTLSIAIFFFSFLLQSVVLYKVNVSNADTSVKEKEYTNSRITRNRSGVKRA